MTALAWLAVIGVLLVLRLVWKLRSKQLMPQQYSAPVPPALPAWQATPVGKAWEAAATAAQVSALKDARDLAAKWGATIGTLLGVFGIVAFAQGPSALTDVPGRAAYVVLVLILLATLAAGSALYTAALAAEATPAILAPFNGWTLKHLYADRMPTVFEKLRLSRALALSAAALIFGAVTVAWLATIHERDAAVPIKVLVTFDDGTVSCGELKRTSTGLTVSGKALLHVKQVAVSKCPKE